MASSGDSSCKGGPHTVEQKLARDNLMGLVGQVDEVKEKMTENMELAMERTVKLRELEDHADKLSTESARLANQVDQLPQKR